MRSSSFSKIEFSRFYVRTSSHKPISFCKRFRHNKKIYWLRMVEELTATEGVVCPCSKSSAGEDSESVWFFKGLGEKVRPDEGAVRRDTSTVGDSVAPGCVVGNTEGDREGLQSRGPTNVSRKLKVWCGRRCSGGKCAY